MPGIPAFTVSELLRENPIQISVKYPTPPGNSLAPKLKWIHNSKTAVDFNPNKAGLSEGSFFWGGDHFDALLFIIQEEPI